MSKCCCDKDLAAIKADIAQLKDVNDELSSLLGFMKKGHPILLIENEDDIACFDLTSGAGSGTWDKWAVCIGKVHKSISANKNITTPNFVDRFVVMATGEYEVGDTGGEKEHTLTTDEIPAHSHGVTDPGHSHVVSDPGHNHGVTDPGHNHTQNPHTHVFDAFNGSLGSALFAAEPGGTSIGNSDVATDPTTATNNANTTGLTVNSNTTGVTVQTAQASVSVNEAGGGEAHENRPPYYAAIYIMYIG